MTRLKKRVAGILTSPRSEWAAIASERDTVGSLYREYVLPLAAIPAASLFIGLTLRGFGLVGALRSAVVLFVSGAIAPVVVAAALQRMAPRFRSGGTTVDALKVVAYASTPVWVAGLVSLLVLLSPLAFLAFLYAVYLTYLGLPAVLKTPLDQRVPFTLVAALTAMVVDVVVSYLLAPTGVFRYGW
jgi:hypothetical protein